MVRKYRRKSIRQAWASTSMQTAIDACLARDMVSLQASKAFGVTWTMLRDRLRKRNPDCKTGLAGFATVFRIEQEEELCTYLLRMEEVLLGMTSEDARSIAYQLEVRNGIRHPFNTEIELAGADWLQGYSGTHKSH